LTLLKNDGALSPFFDCIREAEKSRLKIFLEEWHKLKLEVNLLISKKTAR
jgi:hypothetical protein